MMISHRKFYWVFRFPSERLQNLQQQLQMEASFQSAARSWFLQCTAQSCNLNEKCEKLIMNCIWGTLFDASWFRFEGSFSESALAKPRAVESLKRLQQKRLCWTHWCMTSQILVGYAAVISSAGKCQVDAKLSAEAEARNAAQMQAWPIRKKWKHGNICGEIGYKSLVGSIFIPQLWQRYQVATGVEVELRNRFPSPIQALLQKKNKMLEEALQLALKAQEKVPHPRVFGGLPGVKP